MKKSLLLIFFFILPILAFCHPKGEKNIHGNCDFQRNGNTFIITQKDERAIIHWDDFSIAKEEITKFIQPLKTSAILNRVITKSPSQIFGTLQSNGVVFLINQNGILIGPEGKIQTAGFLASTLNTKDEDFLNGKDIVFKDGFGQIEHLGSIESSTVYFLSRKIEENGKTNADSVHILSGEEILLFKQGDKNAVVVSGKGSIDQKGLIESIKVNLQANGGDLFSLAINQEGIIHANGIKENNGEIILSSDSGIIKSTGKLTSKNENKGGDVHLLGEYVQLLDETTIDVSSEYDGGSVLIGGDYRGENPLIKNAKAVFVAPNVKINASSLKEGNGGKVIVWGETLNQFYGKILAEGGNASGNGGFIEVSSKKHFDFKGFTSTKAPNGEIGKLLLDPCDITISNAVSSPVYTRPTNPNYPNYYPTGAAATLNTADLQNGLANNNVIIDANYGAGGTGTVIINNQIFWSAPTTLTILTPESITVNANVQNTYADGNFNAINFQANTAGTTTGAFRGIYVNGARLSTNSGNISFLGIGGDNTLTTEGIFLDSGTRLSTTSGNITLNGTAQVTSQRPGVSIVGNSVIESNGNGNIFITGHGGGVGGIGSYAYGVHVTGDSEILSKAVNGGSITLTGYADTTVPGTDFHFGTALVAGQISSVDGPIRIYGEGGSSGVGSSYGCGIYFGWDPGSWGDFYITSEGTASIYAEGKSAFGQSDAYGIEFNGDIGCHLSSVSGDITLIGESRSNENGSGNIGITFYMEPTISSQTGTITLTGIGGGGSGTCRGIETGGFLTVSNVDGPIIITGYGGPSTNGDAGLFLPGPRPIQTTGSGSITINGIGTGDWGMYLIGVNINSLGTGDITLNGTVQGTGVNYSGVVLIDGSIQAFNSASITINGTGAPSGGNNSNGVWIDTPGGIYCQDGTLTINGTASSGNSFGVIQDDGPIVCTGPSGAINITGIGAGTGEGIRINADGIGSNINLAPITLTSDTIFLAAIGPAVRSAGTVGAVVVQPLTPSASINVGNAGGVLDLTNATMEQIATGTPGLTIGRADGSHTITVENLSPASVSFTSLQLRGANVICNDPINITAIPLTAYIGQTGNGYFDFNNTATFTPTPVTVVGIGNQSSNTFYGSNTVNDWNITDDNAGTFLPSTGFNVNFINIGNLIGGNQGDTFTFTDQKRLEGLVDGGAPAVGNFLVYSNWSPPPVVVFNTLNDGWASNLDGGFFNIENAFGIDLSPYAAIKVAFAQLSLSYLYMNPSEKDDLFTSLQTYLLNSYLGKENIYWIDMIADVFYEKSAHGFNKSPLLNFAIKQKNKRFFGMTTYQYFPGP